MLGHLIGLIINDEDMGTALKLDIMLVVPVHLLLVLWRRGQFSQYTDNFAEYLLMMVTAHVDAQIHPTEIVVIQPIIEC